MPQIPKEVIDSLKSDNDFLSLPDTEQNAYLDRIGAKYGSMAKPENILQRAAQTALQPMNPAIYQILNPGFGVKPEDNAPMLGQLAGGMSAGFPGAVLGEGAGEGIRQLGKMVRREPPTPMDIPIGMGITAIGEGVPRAAFNSYFGRQIATKSMEGLGKAIGAAKSALASDPTAEVPSGPIVQKLQGIYDGIKKPLQGGAQHIKDWIDHLSQSPVAHATDLQQMEDSFGAYSKYGTYENGAFQPPKSTEPVINAATKEARNVVSSIHDDLAVSKGFTEFPSQSKEFSGYKQRWKDINPAKDTSSKMLGQFGKAGLGYMVGRESGSPMAGVGTYLAENVLTNPLIKGAMFHGFTNPIVNASLSGGRLAGTELARDITR